MEHVELKFYWLYKYLWADGLTFEDGKLTINWKPFSNAGDIEPRTKALTSLLESKL